MIVKIVAWGLVALCGAYAICKPFLIGTLRGQQVHSPGEYIGGLLECIGIAILAGRCLGWW